MALSPELVIAKRLWKTLGRPVPSLQGAECVCGLREGVLEHDRERVEAAIAAAGQLGIAHKLGRPLATAKEEIERLKYAPHVPLPRGTMRRLCRRR